VRVCVSMRVSVCVCVCACVRAHVYVCIFMCTFMQCLHANVPIGFEDPEHVYTHVRPSKYSEGSFSQRCPRPG